MIDQLYLAQLEKQYVPYLKQLIAGQAFQSIVLRGGKNKPSSTIELHQSIKLFQANEKQKDRKGWLIQWAEWKSNTLGKQQWPAVVKVTTEEDFLYLLKKEKEIIVFKKQLEQLLQWRPGIQSWLSLRPKLILELRDVWPKICSVVDYLLQHDVKNHYLRSIPVKVHTKFIAQYKKIIYSILQHLNSERFPLPDADLEDALAIKKKPFLFTLRWLDQGLSHRYTSGMQIFATPVDWLKQQAFKLERVIFVENETNLYLLPPVAGTLAICSHGKALHLLREIGFLQQTRLYYWGDMDEEGFCMLNDIRLYYLHTISLFMDEATLIAHGAELDIKNLVYKKKELSLLNSTEKAAYDRLLENNQWLEQEKLQQAYLHDQLEIALSK